MVPVNQVILGGDPLLESSIIGNSLDEQLQMIERYKQITSIIITVVNYSSHGLEKT